MTTESIFTSYMPVDTYQKFLFDQCKLKTEADSILSPIDAFALKQVYGEYARPPAVVDFLSEKTLGASSIFWASMPEAGRLFVEKKSFSGNGNSGRNEQWTTVFEAAIQHLEIEKNLITFLDTSAENADWSAIKKDIGSLSSVFALFPSDDLSSPEESNRLTSFFSQFDDGVACIASIGKVGSCPSVETIHSALREDPSLRFSLIREISPFLSASNLGVMYRVQDERINTIFEKLNSLFAGNLNYITSLRNSIELMSQDKSDEREERKLHIEYLRRIKKLQPYRARKPEPVSFELIAPPPKPLFIGRALRSLYHRLVPASYRISFSTFRRDAFSSTRSWYHKQIPLHVRLTLRDARILVLGR